MTYAQLFFIFSIVIIAPHLDVFSAKLWSVVCLVLAMLFFILDLVLEARK